MDLAEILALSQEQLNVIKALIYSAFIYLGIDVDVVKILLWLMVIDSTFGVIKTFVLGQSFYFKRLTWGIITKLMTLGIPITVALLAKGINIDLTGFVVLIMNILLVAEAFSIMTNMISIRTKKDVESTDWITRLLSAIRNRMSAILEKFIRKSNQY